ncbi:MAG TPA: hypothetical protein DHM90_07475 [Clostridiaceae bacterium]|nr:hypothetical protein [Clostridiaceae bacterium]
MLESDYKTTEINRRDIVMKWVNMEFDYEFKGVLKAKRGTVDIGITEGTIEPYDMVFGALGSCLYSTFLDIAVKKKIVYDGVRMKVSGEKRTEIPTTLKTVDVVVTVVNPEKEKGLDQALKLATEYCSVYQTLSHVAEMTYSLEFEYTDK